MSKVLKMKPIDQAVLTATEGNDEGIAQPLPPPAYDDSLAELLRVAHARREAEERADDRNKAELDALVGQLITINERKRQLYRDHAAARMQRQVDSAAMAQTEDDERERVYAEEGDVLFKMRQKLYGEYTQPIFLPGEFRPSLGPMPKPKPRPLWRRLLGLR